MSRTHVEFETLKNRLNNSNLKLKLNAMFRGENVNFTEDRASLFFLMRDREIFATDPTPHMQKVNADWNTQLPRLQEVATHIHRGNFNSIEPQHLIVVGIGGSILGLEFVQNAINNMNWTQDAKTKMQMHCLVNIDPIEFVNLTKKVDPKKSITLIISKSFATKETL
mmetsp:Transcript_116060/g.249358  ORF Transcript_116060/g.249358 Transcript_116060/m.249358 type:complete len:167 (-) Transcript_116060:1125-1625(-)